MKNMMRLIQISMALGILSLISLVFGYLAVNDLAHSKGDLHMEWMALRVVAVLVVMFHALALVTLFKALSFLRHGD